MADPTGRIRKLKAGDSITDGWIGQIVDRLNKQPKFRGNVTQQNGSISGRNQYAHYYFLITSELTLEPGDKWLSATGHEWSYDIDNGNSFISSNNDSPGARVVIEPEERIYFPFLEDTPANRTLIDPWINPANTLEDPADDNWKTVLTEQPSALVYCFQDPESGYLVSPISCTKPDTIFIETKDTITAPESDKDFAGPFEAYLLKRDLTTQQYVRCQTNGETPTDILVDIYANVCFSIEAGEVYQADLTTECLQTECAVGEYFLRYKPPPMITAKTVTGPIAGSTGTCLSSGPVTRTLLQTVGEDKCYVDTTTILTVYNPCSEEIPNNTRLQATLSNYTVKPNGVMDECYYEISLVCCPEEGEGTEAPITHSLVLGLSLA